MLFSIGSRLCPLTENAYLCPIHLAVSSGQPPELLSFFRSGCSLQAPHCDQSHRIVCMCRANQMQSQGLDWTIGAYL